MSTSTNPTGQQRSTPGTLNPTQVAKAQLKANSVDERNRIRANATSLSDDEWDTLDEAVFEPLRNNLVLTQAIEGAGLTHDLQWWENESTWGLRGGMTDAEHSMSLSTRSEEDVLAYGKQGTAIPYSIKDYRIEENHLERSRQMGTAIDTAMASEASRQVAELVENTLLYGAPDLQWEDMKGNVLETPGFLNVTGRAQQTASGAWSNGDYAYSDVINAMGTLKDLNYDPQGRGYWLLIAGAQDTQFDEDYKVESDRSIRDKIQGHSNIANVQYVPEMPDGQALVIKPSERVFDLARLPDGPLNIEWSTHGGTEVHNKVYHLAAPRIKHDTDGNTGIVHISGIA